MLITDPADSIAAYRNGLLAEAEQARLAALLPRRSSALRRNLAVTCHRLADWLEQPVRYVQPAESGREDWVGPLVNV